MRSDLQTLPRDPHAPVYSPIARGLHWLTVVLIAVQIPVGLYMVKRGATTFDDVTNALYTAHKSAGALLLLVVIVRLAYRLVYGAPPDEPTLEWWQKAASHLTHWGLYGLLLLVPLLGWLAVSYYDARGLVGGIQLPALAGKDEAKATLVFTLHFWAAMLMLAAIGAHVGAALFHFVIRKDGVLRRMLPGVGWKD